MNKKIVIITSLALLAFIGGLLAIGRINSNNQQSKSEQTDTEITASSCLQEECLEVENLEYPVSELPKEVVSALNAAIDDEYKAFTTYQTIIDNLGSIRPFSMIIRAEEQHISSLKAIYDKYGLEAPENPYSDLEVADTKSENCSIGVQAEIDNAALYNDELLPVVADYPDITSVFTKLMDASQDKHLPAFERCSN